MLHRPNLVDLPASAKVMVKAMKRKRNIFTGLQILPRFLGAPTHLYNWLRPSVGWSVGNANVRRSTRRTLLAYLALLLCHNIENKRFELEIHSWRHFKENLKLFNLIMDIM